LIAAVAHLSADLRISRIAARQHGLVGVRQLAALGLDKYAVEYRVRTGRLHRIQIGVFAVGHLAISTETRLLAAVISCGRDAVLSHDHAGHLWVLFPPWSELDLTTIHVTVPPACGRGRRAGIAVHRHLLAPADRVERDSIPVTSPARTILDLSATLDLRALERVVDQALTDRRATAADLRAIVTRNERRPGSKRLRELLKTSQRFDTLTRSQLEERLLGLVREAGVRSPSLNLRIAGLLVDAVWADEQVAVEVDGYRWHRTRARQESDRSRELTLRRAGWLVLRYSARQLFDEPLQVVADLAGALAARRP
jgi:very-short-patch-repair endonuclease